MLFCAILRGKGVRIGIDRMRQTHHQEFFAEIFPSRMARVRAAAAAALPSLHDVVAAEYPLSVYVRVPDDEYSRFSDELGRYAARHSRSHDYHGARMDGWKACGGSLDILQSQQVVTARAHGRRAGIAYMHVVAPMVRFSEVATRLRDVRGAELGETALGASIVVPVDTDEGAIRLVVVCRS